MRNNCEWSGEFMTMSQKLALCTSEEQMYKILRDFKEDFNSEYGKLSRAKRLKDGFREKY